jgi:hypothetical protein
MDINSLEYRDLVDKFGLNKAEDKEAAYEKVLDFFERKGKMKAYKTLMGGIFRGKQYSEHSKDLPLISRERVYRSIKEGKVSLSSLTQYTKYIVFYMKEVFGMDMEAQRNFILTYDKPFYKNLIEYTLTKDWRNSHLDDDVLKGNINLNTMGDLFRCRVIDGSLNPKKLWRKLSPIKQVATSLAYIKDNFGRDDVISITIPYLKKYLEQIVNDGNEEKVILFGKDILMKAAMKDKIKAFCPIISRILDTPIGSRHPYNLPVFKGCNKKFRHVAQYDFVSKPDRWEQIIVMKNGKFGVIDSKGRMLIEPIYDSIGIPQGDMRIALNRNEEKVDYFNREGQQITGV